MSRSPAAFTSNRHGSKQTDGALSIYFTGAAFQLHPHEPPPVTENKNPRYSTSPQILGSPPDSHRPPPAAPIDIVLHVSPLYSSMRKLTHVWTVHVPAIFNLTGRKNIRSHIHERRIQQIYRPFLFPRHIRIARSRSLSPPSRHERPSLPRTFPDAYTFARDRSVHVLLMEHIDDKDFRILVPVQKAKDVCPAHRLAIINMALNLNLDTFVRGVYPLDFQPRNVILRNPGHRTVTEFCENSDCPVRSEVDLDDVRGVLVDLENVGLGDPMKELRKLGYRAKVVNKQRWYLKRWLENEIQPWGQ